MINLYPFSVQKFTKHTKKKVKKYVEKINSTKIFFFMEFLKQKTSLNLSVISNWDQYTNIISHLISYFIGEKNI